MPRYKTRKYWTRERGYTGTTDSNGNFVALYSPCGGLVEDCIESDCTCNVWEDEITVQFHMMGIYDEKEVKGFVEVGSFTMNIMKKEKIADIVWEICEHRGSCLEHFVFSSTDRIESIKDIRNSRILNLEVISELYLENTKEMYIYCNFPESLRDPKQTCEILGIECTHVVLPDRNTKNKIFVVPDTR